MVYTVNHLQTVFNCYQFVNQTRFSLKILRKIPSTSKCFLKGFNQRIWSKSNRKAMRSHDSYGDHESSMIKLHDGIGEDGPWSRQSTRRSTTIDRLCGRLVTHWRHSLTADESGNRDLVEFQFPVSLQASPSNTMNHRRWSVVTSIRVGSIWTHWNSPIIGTHMYHWNPYCSSIVPVSFRSTFSFLVVRGSYEQLLTIAGLAADMSNEHCPFHYITRGKIRLFTSSLPAGQIFWFMHLYCLANKLSV